MPAGHFRRFGKSEATVWSAFTRLLRALDTSSTAPDDSIILTAVRHDRELWALLAQETFQHLTLVRLEAPLEVLRARLARRLKPSENLEVLVERLLIPGQEWAKSLPAHFTYDTSRLSPDEIVERVSRDSHSH